MKIAAVVTKMVAPDAVLVNLAVIDKTLTGARQGASTIGELDEAGLKSLTMVTEPDENQENVRE